MLKNKFVLRAWISQMANFNGIVPCTYALTNNGHYLVPPVNLFY